MTYSSMRLNRAVRMWSICSAVVVGSGKRRCAAMCRFPIPGLGDFSPVRYWTLTGDKLYFVKQEQWPRELGAFSLKTHEFRRSANIPGELLAGTPGLAVDPGLHSLLFVQKNQGRSSIMLQGR